MSVINVNFGGKVEDLDFLEPTEEDLLAIEADWDLLDDYDRVNEYDLYGPEDEDDRFPFDNFDDGDYDYDDEY